MNYKLCCLIAMLCSSGVSAQQTDLYDGQSGFTAFPLGTGLGVAETQWLSYLELPMPNLFDGFSAMGELRFELENNHYHGISYSAESDPKPVEHLQVDALSEQKNDGMTDYRLHYPNGLQQLLYGLTNN